MLKLQKLYAFLFITLFLWASSVQAQTIRGFITNDIDGLPLQGANIAVKNTQGDVFGTATDSDGYYIITRIPAGNYTLQISFISFETYKEEVTLKAGEILTRSIALKVSDATLGEIVVEAEGESGAASITAGLQTVRPIDIDRIPVPDVSGDLASYLTALPGVVTEGDRGGQLFVRGGTATQNLVLLDNMLVYQPFHILGFYSAFPSDIINKADIYAGGYGAKYGGRISSVIDVGTRNGNKRQFSGAFSAAPFVVSGRLEAPIVKDKVSVLFSGRRSVVEDVGPTLIDRPLPYRFGDLFGKIHASISENSQFSISAIQTFDKGLVTAVDNNPDISLADTTFNQVGWKNEAYGGRYLLLPANYPVSAELVFSYSRLENEFGKLNKPDRTANIDRYSFESNITYYLGRWDLNIGFFLRTLELQYKLGGTFQNIDSDTEYVTEAGTYIETDIGIGDRLRILPGLRVDTFPRAGHTYLEPRLKAIWYPTPDPLRHKISMAFGRYHQEVVGLNDRRDAGDVFTAWSSSPFGAEVPEAIHAIVGWQYRPFPWLEFATEGYYKELSNLAISEWSAFPRFTTNLQPASGEVRGLDVRFEASGKNGFYAYLSYGLSKVDYSAKQETLPIWYGTDELNFNPPHDRRHQVNVVLSVPFFGFELNTRWQFGSGLPYTQSIGFDNWILLDGKVDLNEEEGQERVLYGLPYEARLPDYHRFDVSLERRMPLGKRGSILLQAGLINTYDRPNLFYLDLFTLERVNQLPLIPTFGVKMELQ